MSRDQDVDEKKLPPIEERKPEDKKPQGIIELPVRKRGSEKPLLLPAPRKPVSEST